MKSICKVIKNNWKKDIGIHAHDNWAWQKTQFKLLDLVRWIDGTVQGMGRGAGNVKTENLLQKFRFFKYNASSINNILKIIFAIKKKYKWGKSKYYKIAANYNIHPTYIQMLQNDRDIQPEKIKSINSLKKIEIRL